MIQQQTLMWWWSRTMIYELIKQNSLNVRNAYVFYFDVGPYVYLSKREVGDDPHNLLKLYVPSNVEATDMQKEYEAFCLDNSLEKDNELIKCFTDFEIYKPLLLGQVGQKMEAFENNLNKDLFFTSSLGFKCNGDRRSRDNLQDLIALFDLQSELGTVIYRDYSNETHLLDKGQLQVLLTEHIANFNNLYNQKWKFEEHIKKAQSLDDLRSVDYEFVMADYTNKPLVNKLDL